MGGFGGWGLYWFVFVILPGITGVTVAIVKPPDFVAWINDQSAWWDEHFTSVKTRKGMIITLWSWLVWPIHKLHRWTAEIDDEAVRGGTRFALFFFVGSVSLIVVASLIYLAVIIAVLLIGLWILSLILGDDKAPRGGRWTEDADEPRTPMAARAGRSRERKDWLGNEYTEHVDEDGQTVGRSEVKKDWLGNPYVETTNADGDVVETARGREDWLGNSYVEHRDADDEKTGESRGRKDWLGNDYVEHRDADDVERGRSRKRQDWLGNDYVEHEPKE